MPGFFRYIRCLDGYFALPAEWILISLLSLFIFVKIHMISLFFEIKRITKVIWVCVLVFPLLFIHHFLPIVYLPHLVNALIHFISFLGIVISDYKLSEKEKKKKKKRSNAPAGFGEYVLGTSFFVLTFIYFDYYKRDLLSHFLQEEARTGKGTRFYFALFTFICCVFFLFIFLLPTLLLGLKNILERERTKRQTNATVGESLYTAEAGNRRTKQPEEQSKKKASVDEEKNGQCIADASSSAFSFALFSQQFINCPILALKPNAKPEQKVKDSGRPISIANGHSPPLASRKDDQGGSTEASSVRQGKTQPMQPRKDDRTSGQVIDQRQETERREKEKQKRGDKAQSVKTEQDSPPEKDGGRKGGGAILEESFRKEEDDSGADENGQSEEEEEEDTIEINLEDLEQLDFIDGDLTDDALDEDESVTTPRDSAVAQSLRPKELACFYCGRKGTKGDVVPGPAKAKTKGKGGKKRNVKEKDKLAVELKMCGGCKAAFYCNVQCQSLHWPIHSRQCRTAL